MTHPTLGFADAAGRTWDAVVLGAGPAGTLAARALALAGARVLLVEKKRFPREKVCGACLNGRALAVLRSVGLEPLVNRLGGIALEAFDVRVRGHSARLTLPTGQALSRARLDAALAGAAIEAGADFLPETLAHVEEEESDARRVRLERQGESITIAARVVVVAAGLGNSCLTAVYPRVAYRPTQPPPTPPSQGGESEGAPAAKQLPPLQRGGGGGAHWLSNVRKGGECEGAPAAKQLPPLQRGGGGGAHWLSNVRNSCVNRWSRDEAIRTTVAARSRIGAGCLLDDAPACYREGTIHMAVARSGYVGLVRVEDGALNVAAAFDPTFVKSQGAPGSAAAAILAEAGFPALPSLGSAEWRGTAALTRRTRPVAAHRLFVIGDAAGYVEPFTGEGIAWAFAAGEAVAPLAWRGAARWEPSLIHEWTAAHRRLIGRHQQLCRGLSLLVRHPRLTSVVLTLAERVPSVAARVLQRVNTPPVAWKVSQP